MTENEYIIATSLAQVRAAQKVVGNITSYKITERAVPSVALMQMNQTLADMEEDLQKMLVVTP